MEGAILIKKKPGLLPSFLRVVWDGREEPIRAAYNRPGCGPCPSPVGAP